MRYFTLALGILSIALITIIHFYPDKVNDLIENVFDKKEYIIAKPNDYFLDGNYNYIENYFLGYC